MPCCPATQNRTSRPRPESHSTFPMGTPSSEELELAPCACSAAPCVLQQSGQQGMVSNLTRHARAGAVLRDMFCNDLRLPLRMCRGHTGQSNLSFSRIRVPARQHHRCRIARRGTACSTKDLCGRHIAQVDTGYNPWPPRSEICNLPTLHSPHCRAPPDAACLSGKVGIHYQIR